MTEQSKLPPYLPYPRFLLCADLSMTAKLLYALLLDRANLSKANGWIDEQGRIYLIFPIVRLANAIDRSTMTVKSALSELEAADLIERHRQGFSSPNRIYVKLPQGGQESVSMMERNLSITGTENFPTDGQKSFHMTDRKLSPNHLSKNNLNHSNMSGSKEQPVVFGKYENVYLTDSELAELNGELPDKVDYYIERLSGYIASTGKQYRNHAATILRWAADDNTKDALKRCTPNQGIPVYACKEGVSL